MALKIYSIIDGSDDFHFEVEFNFSLDNKRDALLLQKLFRNTISTYGRESSFGFSPELEEVLEFDYKLNFHSLLKYDSHESQYSYTPIKEVVSN
jgi:hypothetical protein